MKLESQPIALLGMANQHGIFVSPGWERSVVNLQTPALSEIKVSLLI